jgi:hypothetical protein
MTKPRDLSVPERPCVAIKHHRSIVICARGPWSWGPCPIYSTLRGVIVAGWLYVAQVCVSLESRDASRASMARDSG